MIKPQPHNIILKYKSKTVTNHRKAHMQCTLVIREETDQKNENKMLTSSSCIYGWWSGSDVDVGMRGEVTLLVLFLLKFSYFGGAVEHI